MQLDTPEEGRALLDEALDWRGNYYFGCTGNGCVGCSSFQRCFRMLPRWALILGCIACVGALVPWAFKGSLATVNHGGTPMYSCMPSNICRLRPVRSHAVARRGPLADAASGHATACLACTTNVSYGLALCTPTMCGKCCPGRPKSLVAALGVAFKLGGANQNRLYLYRQDPGNG